MSKTAEKKYSFQYLRKDDEYMTPKYALRDLFNYVNIDPEKDKIFEPFYGTGYSSSIIKDMGYKVTPDKEVDFFKVKFPKRNTILVTNPPFSIKREVLQHIFSTKKCKRFAILLPSQTVFSAYFHKMVLENNLTIKILIPDARIQFVKNGVKTRCNALDTCWITSGIDLPDVQGGTHFMPAIGPRDG